METIGIFEVKAKISQICERVKQTGEPVLVTKRGVPLVRIDPVNNDDANGSKVWQVREKYIKEYGGFDEEIDLPERDVEPTKDYLDS